MICYNKIKFDINRQKIKGGVCMKKIAIICLIVSLITISIVLIINNIKLKEDLKESEATKEKTDEKQSLTMDPWYETLKTPKPWYETLKTVP